MRVATGLGATALTAAFVVVAPVAPATADAGAVCSSISDPSTPIEEPTTDSSVPLEQMKVREAQKQLDRMDVIPGEGVVVAVVDSGISGTNIPVIGAFPDGTPSLTLDSPHGTAVAGLIAGGPTPEDKPVGIAPGAELLDVRVYDDDSGDEDKVALSTEGVTAGLNWMLSLDTVKEINIVNISLEVEPSPELGAAVRALQKKGVIVVASAGDRGAEVDAVADEGGEESETAGENQINEVAPAGYPDVVTVTAAFEDDEDPTDFVVQNSAIDVAVPVDSAVSWAVNGQPCLLQQLEQPTSWAAAQVSGILAMLISAYPKDSPQQIVARLYATATGTLDGETLNPLTGRGIVQPVEAIRRKLDISKDGVVRTSTLTDEDSSRAEPPRDEADLLASTRENAVWWGLLAGGALVTAALLRPVLARRRR
ncbi:MAG: S8 family serine peptidase [Nocardioides sp.]